MRIGLQMPHHMVDFAGRRRELLNLVYKKALTLAFQEKTRP